MSFVLGAKPGDHKALFAWVDELESAPGASGSKPCVERWETKGADGAEHVFRWSNGAPLNDAKWTAQHTYWGLADKLVLRVREFLFRACGVECPKLAGLKNSLGSSRNVPDRWTARPG